MRKNAHVSSFFKTSLGNIIEWYDFSLYGIFAINISHAFFSNFSSFQALLLTFLTFSAGFAARPIGSFIFGYIGDKFGRYKSVNISIWCMGLATIFIAFIPGYNQIGFFAPCILLLLRFIQGISAGGQFSGLITIAVDENPQQKSFLVSVVLTISLIGSLLASVVGYLSVIIFKHTNLQTFTWRMPFLISGLLFLIYLWYKPTVEKASENSDYKFRDIFKKQSTELVYMSALAAAMAGIYYIIFSYSITMMREHFKVSQSNSLLVLSLIMSLALILFPIMGKLADKSLCRMKVTKNCTIMMAIAVIPLFLKADFSIFLITLLCLSIIYCITASYLTSIFAEIFDNEYRMTACSISYSIGGVIGSLCPFMAEYTLKYSFHNFLFFILLLIGSMYLSQYLICNTNAYKERKIV
jgi:MHS family proline/betaine transporter-like MFS transporter